MIVGFSALACLLVMGAYPSTSGALSSALGYETANPSFVVKIKKDRKNDDDGDKPKASTKPFTCKKAKCDAGEVKLDQPNIYGACCQAGTDALKPKPAAEKCKFPGEEGPNCDCPKGTEFMGNRGCVKAKSWWCFSPTSPGGSYGMAIKGSTLGEAQYAFAHEMGKIKHQITGSINCKPD